jgi:hypothetical protein
VSAAPDLDGDGVNDLVVLSEDQSKLSVVLGESQGPTLGATASIRPPKDAAVDLAVGDIDGDGRSDIVLLSASLPIADVDGDGRDDVLIGSRPSIGFVESFDLYGGAVQGLGARPIARYSMSTGARVAARH